MSDIGPRDKTRAALENLEPWADDEISRLEKTFAAQGHSNELATQRFKSPSSFVEYALWGLHKGSFLPGFLLGLIAGLALSALIVLL